MEISLLLITVHPSIEIHYEGPEEVSLNSHTEGYLTVPSHSDTEASPVEVETSPAEIPPHPAETPTDTDTGAG